jgi:hypothetical protein
MATAEVLILECSICLEQFDAGFSAIKTPLIALDRFPLIPVKRFSHEFKQSRI